MVARPEGFEPPTLGSEDVGDLFVIVHQRPIQYLESELPARSVRGRTPLFVGVAVSVAVSSVVKHLLPKQRVASSTLVSRSRPAPW